MRWASARCKSHCGVALHGMARLCAVGPGKARCGRARAADGSTEGQPSLLLSMGAVQWGLPWPGEASSG